MPRVVLELPLDQSKAQKITCQIQTIFDECSKKKRKKEKKAVLKPFGRTPENKFMLT